MPLDRRTPPPIKDAVHFTYSLPPIQTHTLQNGIPLYWLAGGVQDVVEVDWVFPAGTWQEDKPAVAQATAVLLKSGTKKRTSHQIAEAFEFYGAYLKAGAGPDWATLTLHCLTKHLDELLPIVHEILTEASFPESELGIYKRNSIQRLSVNLRQSEFVANQKIDALLFGEAHPYGRFTRKEKIEAVTREDVVKHWKACYDLSKARIFMAGKIDEAAMHEIEKVFGATKTGRGDERVQAFSISAPSERVHRVINDPAGVQGAIRIARQFPNRQHPDFAPMVVLNTVFGGYFGSRLMSNIREEKGYTYGIYCSMSPLQHGGSLTVHTEVGRDVAEDAVKEIWKEMDGLCNELVDEEELLLVKNYLLGGLLGDLDGPFQVLARWRTIILNGFTEEQFHRNVAIYKSITAEEVQRLAVKYYSNRQDWYEVVVI
jgi:zinc protease